MLLRGGVHVLGRRVRLRAGGEEKGGATASQTQAPAAGEKVPVESSPPGGPTLRPLAARVVGPVCPACVPPARTGPPRARLSRKQGCIAGGLPPPNLEVKDAAIGSGGAGRGGALSAPGGRPRAAQPGLRLGERAEAERPGSGSSARTAPALRARAANATVPVSPPSHRAMVRGARTLRAGL